MIKFIFKSAASLRSMRLDLSPQAAERPDAVEITDTLKAQKLLSGWRRPLKTAIRAATRIHRRQNRCRQPLCEPQLDHLLAPLASGAARTRRKPLRG